MIANDTIPTCDLGESDKWVSAKLEPVPGHSLAEIEQILAPFAYELRVVDPDVLAYEGEEKPLRFVEGIAVVHRLPTYGFTTDTF